MNALIERQPIMRITVCELPDAADAVESTWHALRAHTRETKTELLVLPEFAFTPPLWEIAQPDASLWMQAERTADAWLARLPELAVDYVIGARPVTREGKRYNEGFLWASGASAIALRRKRYLPNEDGGWEQRWFEQGDSEFPIYQAGAMRFGLNICTELWALETYASYAARRAQVIVSPRATAGATTAKWLAAGTVAAVRSGAFSVSSNRFRADGTYGGVGWIISPDGEVLAATSTSTPFATVDVPLDKDEIYRRTYPRYVFS
ncbi:carbon-nitrogen hydrolase family protein [Oxalobacteraceae bacterium OM1]|nr:carbon-nitrogen hydrolase family protein [Oxalobacteraceae bacterium OM1]